MEGLTVPPRISPPFLLFPYYRPESRCGRCKVGSEWVSSQRCLNHFATLCVQAHCWVHYVPAACLRTSGFLPKFRSRGKTYYFQLAFVVHLLFLYRDFEVSGRQCRVLRDQEDSFCRWFGHCAFGLTSLGHITSPVPQFPSLYLPYLLKFTGGMAASFL